MTSRDRYEAIITAQEAVLVRVASRLMPRNPDGTAELVQEAFVRGYEAFLKGQFREGTDVRAWLIKILYRCFLMECRRQKRFSPVSVDELLELPTTPNELQSALHEAPLEKLLSQNLSEPLERALSQLSEELRIAIWLSGVEECSYQEIAEICDIPLGTVRSRLFRARTQLVKALECEKRD